MLQPASLPPTVQALALVLHVLTGERRDPSRLALVGALASLSTLVQRVQSVLTSDGAVTLTRDDADELAAMGERATMAIVALAAWPSERLTDAPLPIPSPAAPVTAEHVRDVLAAHAVSEARAMREQDLPWGVDAAVFPLVSVSRDWDLCADLARLANDPATREEADKLGEEGLGRVKGFGVFSEERTMEDAWGLLHAFADGHEGMAADDPVNQVAHKANARRLRVASNDRETLLGLVIPRFRDASEEILRDLLKAEAARKGAAS